MAERCIRSDSLEEYLTKIQKFKEFLNENSATLQKNYDQYVDLACGYSQLENEIDWGKVLKDEILSEVLGYCQAKRTLIDYVLGPYFAMCGAVMGKSGGVRVRENAHFNGRGNLYILMCGNPATGKSNGFLNTVSMPSSELSKILNYNPTTEDISRSALLSELKLQDDENRRCLIMASDEMAIKMCGEMKGGSDWDYKKLIYNNAFTGGDINFSRNIGVTKKVNIKKPYLTIIGSGQPKPWMDWILYISNSREGLLERCLFWVVKKKEENFVQSDYIKLDEAWPTRCLTELTKFHTKNSEKHYWVTSGDYNRLIELERNYEQEADSNWKDFMGWVEKGELQQAVNLREGDSHFKIVRFTELTLRFTVCLHLGIHALKCIYDGKESVDSLESFDEISTDIIDFASAFVRRSVRQLGFFRTLATAWNSKSSINKIKNQQTTEKKELHHQESEVQASTSSSLPLCDMPLSEIIENRALLKRVVSFPAPYFVPKAIYRKTPSLSKEIRALFETFDDYYFGKNFIGKVIKLKINKQSGTFQSVLYRAPYELVDQDLLRYCGIMNKSDYEKIMETEMGGDSCPVRKAIETKTISWEAFRQKCEEMKPNFYDDLESSDSN